MSCKNDVFLLQRTTESAEVIKINDPRKQSSLSTIMTIKSCNATSMEEPLVKKNTALHPTVHSSGCTW